MTTSKTQKTEAVPSEDVVETKATEEKPTAETLSQRSQAENTLKDYMLTSAGAGLIPFPVIDVAAFAGANIMLVKRLCAIYGVPFKGNIAKSALTGIGGAVGSLGIAGGIGLSIGKFFPGAGTAAGMLTLPVANTAFTYVVGKAFIGHFEMGGTLLDFNVKDQTEYLKDLYEKGKVKAKSIVTRKSKKGKDSATAETSAEPEAAAV